VLDARPDELRDQDGEGCHGAIEQRVARQVLPALQDVVARGTGQAADIGRPQGGKTGTTTDAKDAWFVGVTPELSIAVWIGDPGTDGEVAGLNDVLGLTEVTGGSLPAALWAEAASTILADAEPTPFPRLEDLRVEVEDDGLPRPGPARTVPAPERPSAPGSDAPPPVEEETDPAETDPGEDPRTDAGDDDLPDDGEDPGDTDEDGSGEGEGPDPPEDDDEDDSCLIIFDC
jgi:membrane peptidoglycan carboxypeptidase